MECKCEVVKYWNWRECIKIYPEWNVNGEVTSIASKLIQIKIYPEWNVNVNFFDDAIAALRIKIYPEWNVNRVALISAATVCKH